MTADMNLIDLVQQFSDEDACRARLEELRWPSGIACIRCASLSIYRLADRRLECKDCGLKFTVTSGTVMHDTHLPLSKWFLATYLMVEAKKGISARQMGRMLAVARKTEWYLSHRIREAMTQAMAGDPPLEGIVEMDETYIGGRLRGRGRGNYRENKAIVVGAKSRDGRVITSVEPNNRWNTLQAFIDRNISPNADAIFTDDYPAYTHIGTPERPHDTVNHSAEEWVRGPVHTNSIEGHWSLFNRALVGSWHQVQHKHLDRYLDEVEWRQNHKDSPAIFRETLRALVTATPLEYKELIAD